MRALAERLLVAGFGVPLLLYAAHHGSGHLAALVVILQCFLLWEWARMTGVRAFGASSAAVASITLGLDGLMIEPLRAYGLVAICAGTVWLLMHALFGSEEGLHRSSGNGILFVAYAAFPLALWLPIAGLKTDHFAHAGALIVLLVSTWVCDTAAYGIGRMAGRHKLWETVSPNKTVEGFVGGTIAAGAVLPLLTMAGWVLPRTADFIAVPLIVGVVGQIGDLFESRLKRDFALKDSSSLLLSHGGFFDRFDSLLLSTPVYYAYLFLSSL